MKEKNHKFKDTLRHIGVKSIITAVIVFLIAAGIAVFVGIRFYAVEKEVLLQQGQLNAKESAAEYDSYLLNRVSTVAMVGYTLEELLASDADHEVFEKYLTDETGYIIAYLDPDTTGLYGWLNGEYVDGSGWVPDEDYVPTERPWYTETVRSDQKITFVEPYLDAQTNTVMMTVSELLGDGESVVAMDASLDPVQQIVEHVSSPIEGSQAFVLDKSGTVVAHSDKEQLGKNYLDDPDSLGGAVAQKLFIDGQMQFDLETDVGKYSVYVDELEGGWYSVSLINADIWYRPLYRAMVIFFVIIAIVLIFLLFVFLRLLTKNRELQMLHTKIDEEEKRRDELQILSETDRMTGLYDHVSGKRKVNELLTAGHGGMFLELDIDHFKAINDTYGHQVGDVVICTLADALRSTFRIHDITMRLGGDEFGVYAEGVVNQEMCEALIHRLFHQLERLEIPELDGKKFCISVGATLCNGKQKATFDDLYAKADSAMYVSKKTDGNSLTFEI